MNFFPIISIITPFFNQAKYLEETIMSVLNQNYPNLEYIIIDGGSTDGSVEIIERFAKNLTYWVSEKDGGLYAALQKGFEKSTGEIMGWINSDDKYHPSAFSTVAEIFGKFPNVNWLLGAATTFDELGRTVKVAESKTFTKYDYYLFKYKWIQQESTFWRRSLWEQAGGYINQELSLAADLELWLRFFRYESLHVTDALIGGFRQRASRQLSLERIKEYVREAETCIGLEKISKTDKKILENYKMYEFFEFLLRKTKVFKSTWITNNFRNKYFKPNPKIEFDRTTQAFRMKSSVAKQKTVPT